MLTEEHAQEILRALRTLPPEKIAEARDFIRFLQVQYGRATPVDESDAWTDEDLRDFAAASLNYADQSDAKENKA
ncbi:MAG: hypothetical protein ABR577_17805 [Pyrinomonadaceae bacterium]